MVSSDRFSRADRRQQILDECTHPTTRLRQDLHQLAGLHGGGGDEVVDLSYGLAHR